MGRPVEFYPFDAEYVRRLCAGDAEVEEHFSGYFGDLLVIKLRAARKYQQSDIDDIVQDTFLRALEKLRVNGLRQPESLGAFMVAICKYVCMERSRPNRLEPLPEEFSQFLQSSDNQEKDLLESERSEALWHSMDEMPEKERLLLKACFFEDRPKDQICREFGVTPNYLRVCLFRAKKGLKRRYLRKFDEKKKDH